MRVIRDVPITPPIEAQPSNNFTCSLPCVRIIFIIGCASNSEIKCPTIQVLRVQSPRDNGSWRISTLCIELLLSVSRSDDLGDCNVDSCLEHRMFKVIDVRLYRRRRPKKSEDAHQILLATMEAMMPSVSRATSAAVLISNL